MNRKLQVAKYVLFDYLAAALAWTAFFLYRKLYIDPQKYGMPIPVEFDPQFYLGLAFLPLCWIIFYSLTGNYKNIYRRSRLTEPWNTIQTSIVGVVIIFFALVLDDNISSYRNYYSLLLTLLGLHFTFTYIPRLILTSVTTHKIHTRKIGFNTLLIGGGENALEIYREIENQKKSCGNKIIGFLKVKHNGIRKLEGYVDCFGKLNDLHEVIYEKEIQEIIIALEPTEHDKIGNIINQLAAYNVTIKAIPSMYDILTGKVRMSEIFGAPLIEISHKLMPFWQQQIKRLLDIVFSSLALVLTAPLSLALMIGIKLTSKGPVFYHHERLGKYGRPFRIYKFRSMYTDAEKSGPQLSSREDPRITPIGRFMRKSRLDEIPNFFNVLKGDMSLVGPRPERPFYIEQIIKVAPHYIHLQKVRPGITSWGQVKFGYASTVDEMVRRLKYDIIYIENMSLYVDFKIMIYTMITVLKGHGM